MTEYDRAVAGIVLAAVLVLLLMAALWQLSGASRLYGGT